MERVVAISWQLLGIRGNYRVHVVLIGFVETFIFENFEKKFSAFW